MRILKQSANAKTWTKKVKCDGCKSTLEVSASDLRKVDDSRDGDYAMCTCPVCHRQITWAQSLIPAAVWATLRKG